MCYTTRISPEFVYPHRSNRDGAGVLAHEVHGLAADIIAVGWDDAEPKPIAVELDAQESLLTEQFNQRLYDSSAGGMFPLAPVAPGSCKYGSLSGSHTNSVLRLFLNSCKNSQPNMQEVCVNDTLSMEALRLRDPGFADACVAGLKWTVLPSALMKEFEMLPGLIQQSANTANQIARAEGELQLARRIHNIWKGLKDLHTTEVTYQQVKDQILRSKPSCAGSVPFLWQYLLKFGGGQDARHFYELAEFVNVWGCTQRTALGSEVWDLLSQDSKVPGELLIRVRHAILRVLFAHVDAKHLTLGDIKRIFSQGMVSKVVALEKLMAEVRQIAADGELPKKFYVDIQMWECNAVEILLDKRAVKHFKGKPECAIQFHLDYIEKQGGPHLTSKWESFQADEPDEDKSAKTSSPASKQRNQIFSRKEIYSFVFCSHVSRFSIEVTWAGTQLLPLECLNFEPIGFPSFQVSMAIFNQEISRVYMYIYIYILHQGWAMRLAKLGLLARYVVPFFTGLRMREYNSDGTIGGMQQLVKELGFQLGDHVTRLKDKVYARIVALEDQFVVLKVDEADEDAEVQPGEYKVPSTSFLKKEWKKYTPKKDPVVVAEHAKHYGPFTTDFHHMIVKARVALALGDVCTKHARADSDIELTIKPSKVVKSMKAFGIGKLVLAPATTKITMSLEGKVPSMNILLGALAVNHEGEKLFFSLSPMNLLNADEKFISPFFFVQSSDDPEECNMELAPSLESFDQTKKSPENVLVKIPIMKNTKELNVGDSLVFFREKKDSSKDVAELISEATGNPAKRRRVKGKE